MTTALGDLPDVEVILYAPHGAPSAQTMTAEPNVPHEGRAGGAVDHSQSLHPPGPDEDANLERGQAGITARWITAW